jgi:hypothetical protein
MRVCNHALDEPEFELAALSLPVLGGVGPDITGVQIVLPFLTLSSGNRRKSASVDIMN